MKESHKIRFENDAVKGIESPGTPEKNKWKSVYQSISVGFKLSLEYQLHPKLTKVLSHFSTVLGFTPQTPRARQYPQGKSHLFEPA